MNEETSLHPRAKREGLNEDSALHVAVSALVYGVNPEQSMSFKHRRLDWPYELIWEKMTDEDVGWKELFILSGVLVESPDARLKLLGCLGAVEAYFLAKDEYHAGNLIRDEMREVRARSEQAVRQMLELLDEQPGLRLFYSNLIDDKTYERYFASLEEGEMND